MTNFLKSVLSGVYDGMAARASSSLDSPSKIARGDISNGDVNILAIKAYSKDGEKAADYKEYVTEFHIYESIVSPVIYCILHVKDAINLAESFKLASGDFVQIRFQTPGGVISEYIFQVNETELNKRKVPSLAIDVYDIELISVEGVAARKQPMGGFDIKGTAGKVIERVLKENIESLPDVKTARRLMSVKPTYAIDSGNGVIGKGKQQQITLPATGPGGAGTLKPFQVIHLMTKLTDKSPEGYYLYTFFERRDGFYFKPIEKLMKDGKKLINRDQSDHIFYYDHLRNQEQSSVKFRNILAYSILSADNAVTETNTVARMVNPGTGEISTVAKADIDNNITELTSAQSLKRLDTPTQSSVITSTEFTHLNEVSVKRQQYISRISQFEAQIMIYGDTNMSVGDVIECNFTQSISTSPSSTDKNQKTGLSKDAAPYLITHLRHIVINTDRPQHAISCNLMRAETTDKK